MKALQITKATREIVEERSSGVCEVCGQERATQMHHRRPRGMGGSRNAKIHEPSMLLHVGNGCHHYIEHNRNEAIAEGWLLETGDLDRPVRTWHGYVAFDDEGGFTGFGFDRPPENHVESCEFWTSNTCTCGGWAA